MTPPLPTVPPPRPADVDTGFWLWIAALPLLLAGQLIDALTTPAVLRSPAIIAATGFLVLAVGAVVATFLFLMRSGYRWARTLLTGGGVATILYSVLGLLGSAREPLPAVAFAATGIIGSVLIGGGIYLLHRPDSHRFFTR